METKEIVTKRVHQGRNVRNARLRKNMKQEALAQSIQVAQSTLSKIENSKFVEEELLQKISKTLDVPYELLRDEEEEASTVVFENNTITNNDSTVNGCASNIDNYTNVFNPIEKIIELYERLIQAEKEKYTALEKRVQYLENK